MRSFRQKLADLPQEAPPQRKDPVRVFSAPHDDKASVASSKPTLDELRTRIAAMVGHREPARPRANPTEGELPFVVEHTASGPRYVRRVRAAPAARVGRAPLVAARDADAVTLGLLALDPALAECDPRKALYLDTETTGLAGGTGTVAFLVGLAFFDEEHQVFVLEQMLLRRLGEEAPILELLTKRIAEASMLVTYNGKAFDVPLLRTRYVMNRKSKPAEPPHLDLLHVARRVHKHRLATCSLASIESEVLGRVRVGDISGMDIVEAYSHFLRTGQEHALHGVVTHNEHDVFSMVALLGLYGEPFGVVDDAPLGHATPAIDEGTVEWETGERERGWAAKHAAGPGAGLGASDLAGVARTLHRAGAHDRAHALAQAAVRGGGGVHARRVSGDIARSRGDVVSAIAEYEALLEEASDPEVRLVLVKMYEHHTRSFAKALHLLDAGTTEDEEATAQRRARLERKQNRLTSAPSKASPRNRSKAPPEHAAATTFFPVQPAPENALETRTSENSEAPRRARAS